MEFDLYFLLQVRKDGTKMSLAQSKKMSQLTADNAQWEDRQLLRSGAVRSTEVQTEFDDEEEGRVILLVHGKKIYNEPFQLIVNRLKWLSHFTDTYITFYCHRYQTSFPGWEGCLH